MKKRLAIAFTGPSNSGKTTLIIKIAQKLMDEHKKEVAIIKHDPGDKAQFDVEGKDSYKFSQTGAEVIVASPTRTTLFSKRTRELEDMVKLFGDFDYLLVEGLKDLPLPRISVFREKIDETYFGYMDALATDKTIQTANYNIPKDVALLDLNNIDEIISWILQNAKEV